MKKVLLLPFFLILGCASGPTIVQGPDGTPHYLISCLNMVDCYNEAARTCEGKYNIVHTANQSDPGGLYFNSQPSRISLLIKCDKDKPSSPAETK